MQLISRFFVTSSYFFIGAVFVALFSCQPKISGSSHSVDAELPPVETIEKANAETPTEISADEIEYKIKLLTIGDFHGDEVTAKSGEKWTGFFVEKQQSYLQPVKIKVKTVPDPIYDNDPKMMGKNVSVKDNRQPIFLLKNADKLKNGKVVTLFHDTPGGDNSAASYLQEGFVKNFEMNGKKYVLRVGEQLADGEHELILSADGVEQIIDKPLYGDLRWAGDLDNDGKLDLFFNLQPHENVMSSILFLSSAAKSGKLIEIVAEFVTVGC